MRLGLMCDVQVPDYLEVIQTPMDLSTIRARVSARHYANAVAFVADFQLMCQNAMVYNPP
jgi:hypothetical protein